ncbi:MAG TPA: hypothetical protein VEB86_19535 [Chryseosolibacter sp.]|nr:hypothetical protein [Chryseosolibacter sp.]
MNTENKALVLEKVLLMLYSVDLKLNDSFKCTASSFTNASTLFKAIFTPLQTHCSNTTKIIAAHGVATLNLSAVKGAIAVISEKLQLHDLIEQSLKHIRQINTEIIKEVIETKKSGGGRTTHDHIKLIADINAAQLACIENQYNTYCLKIDSGLATITNYLADWKHLTSLLKNDGGSEAAFLISRNADLSQRINAAIASFLSDTSYRTCFSAVISELTKSLATISSVIKITNRVNTSHSRLTQLQNMYTTQREREIFNSLVRPGAKNTTGLQKHPDVDIF